MLLELFKTLFKPLSVAFVLHFVKRGRQQLYEAQPHHVLTPLVSCVDLITMEAAVYLGSSCSQLRNKGPSPVNARLHLHFPVQQNGSYLLYVFANASEELLSCSTNGNIDPHGVRGPPTGCSPPLTVLGVNQSFSIYFITN